MRSQSYQSSPITYENISNRINRLKIIGNTKSNIKNNPYNYLKSQSASNINYQHCRVRTNQNINMNVSMNMNYERINQNIGRVKKNTGLKRYTQRHFKDSVKCQYTQQTNRDKRYSRISPRREKEQYIRFPFKETNQNRWNYNIKNVEQQRQRINNMNISRQSLSQSSNKYSAGKYRNLNSQKKQLKIKLVPGKLYRAEQLRQIYHE